MMISEERERYNLSLSDHEIRGMSKGRFRKLVNELVDKYAFLKLFETASKQSKCKFILKTMDTCDIRIQKYLIADELVKEEQLLLFSLRTFTFPVKTNFHYLYESMECRVCEDPNSIENEAHLIQDCHIFQDERSEILNHNDIFGTFEQQVSFIKQFKLIARKWKLILEMKDRTI